MKRKKDICDGIFLTAYGFYLLVFLFEQSFFAAKMPQNYVMPTLYLTVLLIFVKEIYHLLRVDQLSAKDFIALGICLLLFAISYRFNPFVAFAFIFMFGARDVRFEKIAWVTILISAFVVYCVIIGQYGGVIRTASSLRDGSIRQYLGFLYVLNGPMIVFNAEALLLYVRREKMHWVSFIVLWLFNGWLYYQTRARLTIALSAVLLIVAMVLKAKPDFLKNAKVWHTFLAFLPVICVISSLVIAHAFDINEPTWQRLNLYSGKRLYYMSTGLKIHPIKMFGNNILWVGNGLQANGVPVSGIYNYIDNVYIHYLLYFGVIFGIIILALMVFARLQCAREKDTLLVTIFALLAIHGLIDDLIIYLFFNTFMLMLLPLVFQYFETFGGQESKDSLKNKTFDASQF